MSKTPTKSNESPVCYTPKEIVTPNKNNSEVSKIVFIRVSSLHSLLLNWLRLIDKGTKICKSISALKLYDCTDNYYPHQAKNLTEYLWEVLDGLQDIVLSVELLNNQLKALAQLHPQGTPVIFTWSALQIYENVSRIFESLQKEYALKHVITENIAHCRDENLIEVYVTGWEFDVYLNLEANGYLFAEIGLPGIT